MESILATVSSPIFWIGTVIGGLLLHVLGHYAFGWTEKWLAASSSWWRRRSEYREKVYEEAVSSLANDDHKMAHARYQEIKARLQSMSCLMMGMLIFIAWTSHLGSSSGGHWFFRVMPGAIVLLSITASFGAHLIAFDLGQKSEAAQQRRDDRALE